MDVKVRRTDANDLVSGHSPEQDLGQNRAKRQVVAYTMCVPSGNAREMIWYVALPVNTT
jgi:hypothetical protein